MFNSTSKILPYISPDGQIYGVVLPYSGNVLSFRDVDEKIKRAKNHIANLTKRLPQRNTHGGKRFRAKRISLQGQISQTSKKLKLLQSAKAVVVAIALQWITPGEQLRRLRLPIKELISGTSEEPGVLIPDLAGIVAQYTPLDPQFTNWYTALRRLKALPKKIPPLPPNIRQIMNGKCPIYGQQKKPDGTDYKVGDTHFLQLVPQELGTINRFAKDVLTPYGEKTYPADQNPLQFRYFRARARQEHGNVPFGPTRWVLMTKDILPESRNESYQHQAEMIASLSLKASENYELPSLQATITALFLHKVATGKSLYHRFTWTRVQETTDNKHLIVGGFAPCGLFISLDYDYCDDDSHDCNDIGVAAQRKF